MIVFKNKGITRTTLNLYESCQKDNKLLFIQQNNANAVTFNTPVALSIMTSVHLQTITLAIKGIFQ